MNEEYGEEEEDEDLGQRKMDYFKMQCRNLLGPNRVNIKMRVNLEGF